jgi:LytR cell envelope-related transcriptional attenuator
VEYPGLANDLRPWRTAAVVASAVAALELLVLVVLGVALLAPPVADHARKAAAKRVFAPPAAPKKPKRPAVGKPRLARGDTSVLVLNGNGRTGAAAAEADRVRVTGHRIASVGDAPRRDYSRSLVMYRPGFAAEGRRLAKDLRIRIVGPLDGIGVRALSGAHAVVVVGDR